jgi:hypothetical protein
VNEEAQAVPIASRDYWFKVVEMLQQNWALIDPYASGGATVWFVTDTSRVFDEMAFPSCESAKGGLERNGFRRYADDPDVGKFIKPPSGPFVRGSHPNGPIYSSGRFWR